jgi:hypothetical protein
MGAVSKRLAELAGLPDWPLLLTEDAAAVYLSQKPCEFAEGVAEGTLPPPRRSGRGALVAPRSRGLVRRRPCGAGGGWRRARCGHRCLEPAMKVRIKGVYAALRMVGGRPRVYYYHRKTGTRLPDDPTSPEFLDMVARLNRPEEQDADSAMAGFPDAVRRREAAARHAAAQAPLAAAAPGTAPVSPLPAKKVKPALPDRCFKLLFERFKELDEYTDLAGNTQKEYARHMRHVEPVLGFQPRAEITTVDMTLRLQRSLDNAPRCPHAHSRHHDSGVKIGRRSGVRPCRWTGSSGGFDRVAGVAVLELDGAEIAQGGV